MKTPPRLKVRSKVWICGAAVACVALCWWFVVPNLYRQNPLYKAVVRGDTNAVGSRIKANPAEIERRFFGLDATPLHLAAGRGDTNMINLLLTLGAAIEAKGYRNLCTPLQCAAVDGSVAAVAVLLAHGADVNARDRDQKTALHYAAFRDNPEMIRFLAEHGADINAEAPTQAWPPEPSFTPLIEAVKHQRTNACRTLLELGAKADFAYLRGLIGEQRSGVPLASKERRGQWDATMGVLEEFSRRRSVQ